ncbi:MAG: hypothetical protein J0L75_08365 [Spirochaetes bacterium]|nr:hypothetical protein [Spirochaetota bacterium]
MAKIELREHTINLDALGPGGAFGPPTAGSTREPVTPSRDAIDIPFWGTVPAGVLTETGERSGVRLTVKRSQIRGHSGRGRSPAGEAAAFSMHGDENLFALQIRGESMVGAGIDDGDLILFRRTAEASAGQIAVVMVDGDATLKRVFIHGAKTELRPCNDQMAPIWVETDRLRIKGVMVGKIEKAA